MRVRVEHCSCQLCIGQQSTAAAAAVQLVQQEKKFTVIAQTETIRNNFAHSALIA